jgi:hypothetical protein
MKNPNDFDDQMFQDIQELCICSAKAAVVIAKRYNEDPRLVSQLFMDAYQRINDALEKSDG